MIFEKGNKTFQWEKNSIVNKWCRISTCDIVKLDPCLTPFTKMNSEWIIDLNVDTKTMNSQKKTGVSICDLGLDKALDMTQKTQTTKEKIETLYFIKIKDNLILKMVKESGYIFEDTQMVNKHMKRYSASLIIRDMQIRPHETVLLTH